MHIGIGPGVALGAGGGSRYQTFQINGLWSTGQSLAIGQSGTPVLTTVQPYANRMFVAGVRPESEGDMASLVPLVEGDQPTNETPWSSCANLVTSLAETYGRTHDAVTATNAQGSTAYVFLSKGQALYDLAIDQITAAKALADGEGKSFGVSAMFVVHGESDADGDSSTYDTDIVTWQSDYEGDIQAITGQGKEIPHFHTQISAAEGVYTDTGRVALQQLAAHVAAPGKVILVGPKYHLPKADAVHLTNEGYRQLGEHYARAYHHVVLRGQTWEPVRPREVSRVGATVTVRFYVPVPPLVFDTDIVAAVADMGFEWSGGGASISSVDIVSEDTVEITLSGSTAGTLSYAMSGDREGNLRDSDATASLNGYDLFNWCCHFEEAVA